MALRTYDAPPMWALSTCGEPNEIKKNTHPKKYNCSVSGAGHAPEVNLYASSCSATQWQSVVAFANDVYKVAKAANASVAVFPSFQAAFLRGEASASDPCHGKPVLPCIAAAKLLIQPLSRDLFAYASRAVQFHPHGGQSDFVWLSARTPHGGASYVW